MSKHTPGPWTIKRDETADERGMWIIEYRDLVSEEKYGFKPWMSTIAEVGGPYDKEEANAHLIAAAPEMLKELKFISAFLTPLLPQLKDQSYLEMLVEKADRAISKAEGRTSC
jgi:hypothetical protein